MTLANTRPAQQITVDTLVRQARENERKWQRMQSAELRLMSSATLDDCLSQILGSLPRRQGWDGISLTLVDEDYALRRMLGGPEADFNGEPGLRFVDSATALESTVGLGRRPLMEQYRERRHSRLFGSRRFESVCILPLIRGADLVGSLALASNDAERFDRDVGGDFLEHLAAVVAISIEAVSARDQLRMISLTDPLTGVNNRRYFDRRLRDEVVRARRDAVPVALLFIDVDHFKTANDVGGHAYGDTVLRKIAEAIGREVRQSDIVCRYGGDEFACLLTGTDLTGACDIADRVRLSVETAGDEVSIDRVPSITVSIGVASVSASNDSIEALLQRADDAVYAAKDAGRNSVKAVGSNGRLVQAEPLQERALA